MEPKIHICSVCGYTWEHGQNGYHNCSPLLQKRIKELESALESAKGSIIENNQGSMSMDKNFKDLRVRPAARGAELIIDFEGDRHHLVSFSIHDSATIVAGKLRGFAEQIFHDENLIKSDPIKPIGIESFKTE